MDKQTGDEAAEALAKVVRMIEREEMIIFTPSEANSLRELVKVWNQLKAVVAVGSAVGNTLKWAVGIAIAWTAFKAGIFDWIKSSAK